MSKLKSLEELFAGRHFDREVILMHASMRPLAAVEDHAPSSGGIVAAWVRTRVATNTAGSSRGPWYLARAKALSVGLSNAYFRSLGLPSLFENC
jgi:hypothetical protein